MYLLNFPLYHRNKLALAYCNTSSKEPASQTIQWLSPTPEIIFESTYPVHFRYKEISAQSSNSGDAKSKNCVQIKGFIPFSYKTTISFDNVNVMHPNGSTAHYTHNSEYYVDSGVYEVTRNNFGDANFIKISFNAGTNITDLQNQTVVQVHGRSLSDRFKFKFYIYGENSDYIYVKCNKISPCNIIVRKLA